MKFLVFIYLFYYCFLNITETEDGSFYILTVASAFLCDVTSAEQKSFETCRQTCFLCKRHSWKRFGNWMKVFFGGGLICIICSAKTLNRRFQNISSVPNFPIALNSAEPDWVTFVLFILLSEMLLVTTVKTISSCLLLSRINKAICVQWRHRQKKEKSNFKVGQCFCFVCL